jgi:predicted lipoprotein with Yx(FWY)xxD motif
MLWTPNGVAISTAARHQGYPTIVADGAGGAIITWFDQRTGDSYTFSDIYAQRISSDGTVQWTANGVPLCTATGDQSNPTIATDGASGAIVTWFDYRNGNYDIFAQRIDASGTVQWAPDGVALNTLPGEQAYPTIVSDAAGGAIVTWRDHGGKDYDIRAQRISGAGAIQWISQGVAVCSAFDDQYDPTIISDGAGGAIISWWDFRFKDGDIFARRILADGTPQWTPTASRSIRSPEARSFPRSPRTFRVARSSRGRMVAARTTTSMRSGSTSSANSAAPSASAFRARPKWRSRSTRCARIPRAPEEPCGSR